MTKNQIKPTNGKDGLKNNNNSKNLAIDDKVKGHLRKHLKISHQSKHLNERITLEVNKNLKANYIEPKKIDTQSLKKDTKTKLPLKQEKIKTELPLKKTMKKRDGDDSAAAAGGAVAGDQKETPGPVEETCVVDIFNGMRTPEGCKTKDEKAAAVEVPCVINEDKSRTPEGCKTTDEKAAEQTPCVVAEDGKRSPENCLTKEEVTAAEEKKLEKEKPTYVPSAEEQLKLDAELLVTNANDKAGLSKHTYQPVETVRKVSSAAKHLFDDKKNQMFEFVVSPGWEQPKIYRGVIGEMKTSVIVNKDNAQGYTRTSKNNDDDTGL
jgi:hypothetical protein